MSFSAEARGVLARFAVSVRELLTAAGWTATDDQLPDGSSIFLGTFERALMAGYVARLELILERGPTTFHVRLFGPAQTVEASVGGELGLRHEAAARSARSTQTDDAELALITLDLQELAEESGEELVIFSNASEAEAAATKLADLIERRGILSLTRVVG